MVDEVLEIHLNFGIRANLVLFDLVVIPLATRWAQHSAIGESGKQMHTKRKTESRRMGEAEVMNLVTGKVTVAAA